jgi:hypothetical protein
LSSGSKGRMGTGIVSTMGEFDAGCFSETTSEALFSSSRRRFRGRPICFCTEKWQARLCFRHLVQQSPPEHFSFRVPACEGQKSGQIGNSGGKQTAFITGCMLLQPWCLGFGPDVKNVFHRSIVLISLRGRIVELRYAFVRAGPVHPA